MPKSSVIQESEGRSSGVAASVCWGSVIPSYFKTLMTIISAHETTDHSPQDLSSFITKLFGDGTKGWKFGKLKIQSAGISQMHR